MESLRSSSVVSSLPRHNVALLLLEGCDKSEDLGIAPELLQVCARGSIMPMRCVHASIVGLGSNNQTEDGQVGPDFIVTGTTATLKTRLVRIGFGVPCR